MLQRALLRYYTDGLNDEGYHEKQVRSGLSTKPNSHFVLTFFRVAIFFHFALIFCPSVQAFLFFVHSLRGRRFPKSLPLPLLCSQAFTPLGDLTNEIKLTFWKKKKSYSWFFCSTPSGGCNSTQISNARIDSRELALFDILKVFIGLLSFSTWSLLLDAFYCHKDKNILTGNLITRLVLHKIFKYPQVAD